MNPEQARPLRDDRRPKAPPNHPPTDAEGPPEPAGARYASGSQTPAAPAVQTLDPAGSSFEGVQEASRRAVRRRAGRDRVHVRPGRAVRITVRYAPDEHQSIRRAAELAGYTPAGFVALASIAAAQQTALPDAEPLRQALTELMTARTQVRRFAVNVNQAVAVLNATGEPPGWLREAVAMTARALDRLDVAAGRVVQHLR